MNTLFNILTVSLCANVILISIWIFVEIKSYQYFRYWNYSKRDVEIEVNDHARTTQRLKDTLKMANGNAVESEAYLAKLKRYGLEDMP